MKRRLLLSFCLALSFLLIATSAVLPIFGQSSHILSIKRVDSSGFPLVKVYFTLYDSTGIPTSALSKQDMELKENQQKVDSFNITQKKNEDIPKYVALLIDNSGSMSGDPLDEAKGAAKKFVSSLNDIDQVKVYVFNDNPEVLTDFTNNKGELNGAIDKIESKGKYTALNLAVYNAAKDLEAQPSGQRVITLLTDGKDENASIDQDDAIKKAADAKIPIYSVGFGSFFDSASKKYDPASSEALSRFSILTGGVFFIASQQGQLAESLVKVSDLLKFQFVLEYSSSLPKDAKEYQLELKAKVAGENLIDTAAITTPTFDVAVNLDSIADMQEITQKTTITPGIEVSGGFLAEDEIKLVKYYIDTQSNHLKDVTAYPFSYELDPEGFGYGKHTLIVKVYDSLDRSYDVTKDMVFPSPPIYKNPLFYIPVAAVLAILAIVLPIVLVKRRKKTASPPPYVPGFDPSGDITSGGGYVTSDTQGLKDEGSGTWPGQDPYAQEPASGSETVVIRKDLLRAPVFAGWLAVTKGKSMGKEYSIPPDAEPDKQKITVGRDTSNDIVLDDPAVTRNSHFIIRVEDAKYKIIDTGSTNGTYLNGKRLFSQTKLEDGDTILAGDTEMEFKMVSIQKEDEKKPKAKGKGK